MSTEPQTPKRRTTHFLDKYPQTARKSRKRYSESSKFLSARRGRTIAVTNIKKGLSRFAAFAKVNHPHV